LSAAFELARLGYSVEIHEAEKLPGGILTYGIPAYRLDQGMVNDEIEYIEAMGVKIITDSPVNNLADFASKYDAIFIGVGAYRPLPLNIKGEDLPNIYQAAAYLKDLKIAQLNGNSPSIQLGEKVIIIGGGNTAIDAAMSARFSDAEVTVFYRRRPEDMPAFKSEIAMAKRHGVDFQFNYSPIQFSSEGDKIKAVFCKNKMGEFDRSGRPVPVPIDGSEEEFLADNVLVAIGQGATFNGADLVKTDKRGLIIIDEFTGATSMPGVFAGGDAVNGGATAVRAVADGRRAAFGIDKYIMTKK